MAERMDLRQPDKLESRQPSSEMAAADIGRDAATPSNLSLIFRPILEVSGLMVVFGTGSYRCVRCSGLFALSRHLPNSS